MERIVRAAAHLEAWFETMRCSAPYAGYGGAVVHWWQNSLQFTGAGFDWRYEGILHGYLNLYRATNDRRWLDKAIRAGDDVCAGQYPDSSYANSVFEQNPRTGGKPGEAAVDIGLLALATTLRAENDARWERYAQTAQRNIEQFLIGRLWDESKQWFKDSPSAPTFVPNKAATICEALFLLSSLTHDSHWIEQYALPTLDAILRAQRPETDGTLAGGIYQNWLNGVWVERFMPYYVARCVPALIQGYEYTKKSAYLDAALNAIRFCFRWRDDDGGFVQMIYSAERINRHPRWVTGMADILRAADLLVPFGFEYDAEPSVRWLLDGQHPNGGIMTARGFGSQITQKKPDGVPDFRDILPVCGWADKAFRYLTGLLPAGTTLPIVQSSSVERDCLLRRRSTRYHEDSSVIELLQGKKVLYRWQKGAAWASVCEADLLWK